ncbi:unnamed protein product, partial [Rotaria sordida]
MDDAVAAALGRPSAFEIAIFSLTGIAIDVVTAVAKKVSDVVDVKGGSRNCRGG